MTQLFLGLDGGQSGTTAVIGNAQGLVLGHGEAGPCDHAGAPGGAGRILSAIRDSVSAACRDAGLAPEQIRFKAACLGFSGGPSGKRAIVEQVVPAENLILTTDASIALTGATGGEPGIITIAGTGSIAFGRDAAGHTARAGGWGYLFGDEGGAFDMVRQSLRAALSHEEGRGPATALSESLRLATGVPSLNEILHLFYTADYPRDRIASYAPLVDQAAQAGDGVACQILENAAQQLALITRAVRTRLFAPGETARVAYSGGAFASDLVLDRFRVLVEADAGCRCAPPLHSPAVGALIEALRVLRSQF